MRNLFKKGAALVAMTVASVQAFAASVLDAATKTAVTSGFTDMKDTLLDVLGVAWPYVIAGSVLLATPQIVKSLLRDSTKK